MQKQNSFDFGNQVKMSQGIAHSLDFRYVLLDNIPGSKEVKIATEGDDKKGTDWWVVRNNGKDLSIDLKARDKDFKQDDLALEIWSVKEFGKIGWTRDVLKNTDYILWFWNDSKRWCLLPFPMLCKVFILNYELWSKQYKTALQFTPSSSGGYHSECVFVPRLLVWGAIIKCFGGVASNKPEVPT